MQDTGGDGWQGASFVLYNSSSGDLDYEGHVQASGTLEDGYIGFQYICVIDGCYELVIGGGTADSEIGTLRPQGWVFGPAHGHFCVCCGGFWETCQGW